VLDVAETHNLNSSAKNRNKTKVPNIFLTANKENVLPKLRRCSPIPNNFVISKLVSVR